MRMSSSSLLPSSSCKQASKQEKVPGSHPYHLVPIRRTSHLTVPSNHQVTKSAHDKTQTDTTHPHQVGVHRDCFGCGRTCEACKAKYIRTCRYCRAEYCVIDNEGSSETEVCSNGILSWRHIADLLLASAIGAIRVEGGRGRCFEATRRTGVAFLAVGRPACCNKAISTGHMRPEAMKGRGRVNNFKTSNSQADAAWCGKKSFVKSWSNYYSIRRAKNNSRSIPQPIPEIILQASSYFVQSPQEDRTLRHRPKKHSPITPF